MANKEQTMLGGGDPKKWTDDHRNIYHPDADEAEARRRLEEKRGIILKKNPGHAISKDFNAVYLVRVEDSTKMFRICALFTVNGKPIYREYPFDGKMYGIKPDPNHADCIYNVNEALDWWWAKDVTNRYEGVALICKCLTIFLKTPSPK